MRYTKKSREYPNDPGYTCCVIDPERRIKMNNIRKNIHRVAATVLMIVIMTSVFVSCSGGIDKDSAKLFIGDFLEVVSSGDFETAESYLHPDCLIDLEKVLDRMENEENVDFQEGITVERYVGFSSSYYDSSVDGSRYALTMKVLVGYKAMTVTVTVAQNGNGYGIWAFETGSPNKIFKKEGRI